ncbi:MAG: glycosyltransferase family 2 protein [Bryobacterales bacterium]|nr:glycosyltransferase family 2 protein [Bryobacterales bacterium]
MNAESPRSGRFPNSLSVFFPAFNDAGSIAGLVEQAFRVCEARVDDFEVIVVNDGSRDDTADVLEACLTRWGDRFRIVTHERNRGYGGALQSGFAAAAKDYVFYTDGDGQYDVVELVLLLDAAMDGVDWVNGYKKSRSDQKRRILLGAAYREFVRWLFSLHLKDIDCDFRLIRRDRVRSLALRSLSGTICVELVWGLERLGLRAVELGVTHRARLHGQSEFFRLAPLWKTARELSRLIRLRFSAAPVPDVPRDHHEPPA